MLTDVALPGTHALLGTGARAVLAPAVAAAGGRLAAARATQVRYEPGRLLAARFAADVAWAGASSERRETLGALIDRRGLPAGLAVVADEHGAEVGVWRYPHDPFLPGLPHAAYPQGARRILREMGVRADDVRVTPVVYRPGSRAVLRLDVGCARLYAKVLRPGQVEPLRQAHGALGERVPVPRCLGWSDTLGLMVLEALPGRTLTRALVDGGAPAPRPARLLGLLDRFADVPVPGSAHRGDRSVAAHADLLAAVVPELAGRVAAVAAVAGAVPTAPDRTVHGDFHQGQVLVEGDEVAGLLDVDGVRPGTAHDDPAVLLAHLLVLAHVRPRAAPRIDAYRRAVAALAAARIDPEAVSRAAAGVLLGLATTPFRRQEPDWPARTRRWIELAAAEARLPEEAVR